MRGHMKTTVILLGATLALGGCGAQFLREAGTSIDNGTFGNATMNNT